MSLKRKTRITSEHNSDGTHNATAQDTLNITVEHNSDGTHATGIPTKYYESAEQTITSAGSLQLTHSLGAEPLFIQCFLVCKTTQGNYSVDDKVFIETHGSGFSYGLSIVPDSTYLNVRFCNVAGAFNIVNKTTGAMFQITNANWKLIVRAWA